MPTLSASRITFLFSDTGGGHRASAQAVARALEIEHPGRFDVQMLDPFAATSRPLLRWIVFRYSWAIRHIPHVYGFLFHTTDNRPVSRAAIGVFGHQIRPGLERSLREAEPACIVSFHPLTNHLVVDILRKRKLRIPFITVVTDMSEFHRFWLSPGADLVVVPSQESRRYCVQRGLDPRRVHIAGLPVDPRFTGPLSAAERSRLRQDLGLEDRPTLLLTSGGEGQGNVGKCAEALDDARLGIQMVVVCGRNEKLRRKLASRRWNGPVQVHGFVDTMPDLMRVADAVVTKAGPGTIAEALVSGLAIFITDFVPGQEEGNIHFVTGQHVGWHTPRPAQLVESVRRYFGPEHEELERTRGRAEMVGRPGAAAEVAQLIAATVEPSAAAL